MPYPPAPWPMHGQMWLSLFRVRRGAHPDRPPGVYGVALVDYEEPSPLTYGELLVARPVRGWASITDIWVDSADSRDGGREMWAIPKDLADFRRTSEGDRVEHTAWQVTREGRPVVSATFGDVARLAPRVPFRSGTLQHRPEGHPHAGVEVRTSFAGSARVLPCRAHWHFDDQGPLSWLAGGRPLGSVRVADFQLSFG